MTIPPVAGGDLRPAARTRKGRPSAALRVRRSEADQPPVLGAGIGVIGAVPLPSTTVVEAPWTECMPLQSALAAPGSTSAVANSAARNKPVTLAIRRPPLTEGRRSDFTRSPPPCRAL